MTDLTQINDEDRDYIHEVWNRSKVTVFDFGNFLDAAIMNNQSLPLKTQINIAQSHLNQTKQKDKKKETSRDDSNKNFTLPEMIEKLWEGNPKAKTPYQSEKYGQVAKKWNDDLEISQERSLDVEIEVLSKWESYNHWYLSQQNRIDALNSQFDYMVDSLKKDLRVAEFSDLGQDKNDIVTVVGRLMNTDPDLEFQKNIELVNFSDDNEGRKKVKLNLDQVKDSYTLFEGQIVVCQGTSDLNSFDAINITTPPLIKSNQDNVSMETGSWIVQVFNGPYTSKDALDYVHLLNIMELISEEKPEIAILTGPFVDIEHELVKEGELFYKNSNGEIDCFEDADIYKAIKNYLSKFVGNTKIMVIPSLNDASSLHPFPQPALTKNVDKKGNEITDLRFLSNPCRLRINGIDFAITNTGKNLK